MKPPVFANVACPQCGAQHIDRNTDSFPFAEKNHSMHLCLKADGGCGRRFFTKANIGVAPDDPRVTNDTEPTGGGPYA